MQAAENTEKFLSSVHVVERLQYEGQDPLWHPSSWREVTLSTGQGAKAGVMGATKARREAWLEDWERLVLANAQAGLPVGMDRWRPDVPVATVEAGEARAAG
ncbi:hypothetical protein APY04_0813 [Hyphomicrobium sulfonivorans]|uniref:Uncharacterized protein n=1 Tax=Hyphomicrobium sulfonivorans TaxID=121290 RepID=A0A120CXD3_HYPSL|nr:hypothetical protein [Hyphomicrobium sulfonivorans]KWT70752.1 hypothetical protein APY04_0813 [Hyphomicrobium sulfonivorans]